MGASTSVQITCGLSEEFLVSTVTHQGYDISLFMRLVMDVLAVDVKRRNLVLDVISRCNADKC